MELPSSVPVVQTTWQHCAFWIMNTFIWWACHNLSLARKEYETNRKYFQYFHLLLTFLFEKSQTAQHWLSGLMWLSDAQWLDPISYFPLPLFLLGLDSVWKNAPITRAGLCVQWRLCGPGVEGFSWDPNGSLCLSCWFTQKSSILTEETMRIILWIAAQTKTCLGIWLYWLWPEVIFPELLIC